MAGSSFNAIVSELGVAGIEFQPSLGQMWAGACRQRTLSRLYRPRLAALHVSPTCTRSSMVRWERLGCPPP